MAGYRFDEFRLDTDTRQLVRAGSSVHLSPKAFQLLQALIEAAPRALSKAELQERLWPATFVVEANLHHLVAEIRGALGDDPRTPRFVRTVHRFGYAFQEPLANVTAARRRVVCLLKWDGGRASLTDGEHVIGRDPGADVVIDSTSVSRRHARIRVGPEGASVEDAGSKNGSFLRGRRIEGSVALADGDELTIGVVPLTVRIITEAGSTETAIVTSGHPR